MASWFIKKWLFQAESRENLRKLQFPVFVISPLGF